MKSYSGKNLEDLLQSVAREKGVKTEDLTYFITEEKTGFLGFGASVSADIYALSDVRDFSFPAVPLLIFMWHPFVGPVFERVMDNLKQSLRAHPREVYLVYLKPEFGHVVERIPAFRKLWEADLTMSEQDFSAYLFPDQTERCAAYGTS